MLLIWTAAIVVAVIVMAVAGVRLVGRLGELRRAAVKLQRRQEQAMTLQASAAELEQTLLAVQRKADTLQERLAALPFAENQK